MRTDSRYTPILNADPRGSSLDARVHGDPDSPIDPPFNPTFNPRLARVLSMSPSTPESRPPARRISLDEEMFVGSHRGCQE